MRQYFALVMTALALSPATGFAKPGEWIQLGRESYALGDTSPEQIEKALSDVDSIAANYRPATDKVDGAKIAIRNLRVERRGGKPVVTFKTHVSKYLFTIKADVRADVHVGKIDCTLPPNASTTKGYRVELLLPESDEWVSGNASNFRVDLCFARDSAGRQTLLAIGSMREGPKKGKMSFPEIQKFLAAQIRPLYEALKTTVALHGAADAARRIASTSISLSGSTEPCAGLQAEMSK